MQSESPTSGQPSSGLSAAPLFHAAWLFAAGIAVTHWVWLRPGLVLVALAPVAVLCCVAAMRAQRVAWLPLATLWCLAGRLVCADGAAAGPRARPSLALRRASPQCGRNRRGCGG